VLYACDLKWWDKYHDNVAANANMELWTQDEVAAEKYEISWVKGVNQPGLGRDCIHFGGNSGYQAINLAYLWGASRIVLLGFDCKPVDGKHHWFGQHPAGLTQIQPYDLWLKHFNQLAEELRAEGVQVINCSSDTALTCFERKPIEQTKMNEIHVLAQYGLGDGVYHRPFIKQMVEQYDQVYLETPWPELYSDLPLKFVRPRTTLRTQRKNIERLDLYVDEVPRSVPHTQKMYTGQGIVLAGILGMLSTMYGLPVAELDLPSYPRPKIDKPYMVVRPVTLRKEWRADARGPRPEYLRDFVDYARQFYTVVSVADLEEGEEWIEGPFPYADITYHKGELMPAELLGLIEHAALVVGGVGFIVPICIAYKTPLVCILGGLGAYNSPEVITHPTMDLSRVTFFTPDNFCRCTKMSHTCDKTISNFREKTETYFDEIQALCV
jgi:hypothetical protein